jgi:hypothetical protein
MIFQHAQIEFPQAAKLRKRWLQKGGKHQTWPSILLVGPSGKDQSFTIPLMGH